MSEEPWTVVFGGGAPMSAGRSGLQVWSDDDKGCEEKERKWT